MMGGKGWEVGVGKDFFFCKKEAKKLLLAGARL
jgi:hypothetical protein